MCEAMSAGDEPSRLIRAASRTPDAPTRRVLRMFDMLVMVAALALLMHFAFRGVTLLVLAPAIACLAAALGELKMGDVADFRNFMGAVIDGSSFRTQKEAIDAARAVSIGLVSDVVPTADLDGAVESLLEKLSGYEREAVATCKSYLKQARGVPYQTANDLAGNLLSVVLSSRQSS